MPSRRPVAVVAVIAILAALSAGARSVATNAPNPPASDPLGLPATVVADTRDVPSYRTFPVYGPDGQPAGTRRWMVSLAGGNCCEVDVVSTPSGRLVEFGGTFPYFSDDAGKTWSIVKPAAPLVSGEGSATVAPNGDIRAVGWDTYGGDHLEAFVYDAASHSWKYGEAPLHTPIFDRPWVTVARGPLTIDGVTCDYPSLVVGGLVKTVELISCDGLTYTQVGFDTATGNSAGAGPLPATADPSGLADYWSPPQLAGLVPLSGQGLTALTGSSTTCWLKELVQTTGTWRCRPMPGSRQFESLRQDSRGWLTEVSRTTNDEALQIAISTDGGASWSRPQILTPPTGGRLELFDVHVNGSLALAAVNARFEDAQGRGQDVLFQVDEATSTPRLVETDLIGKGDLVTGNSVAAAGQDRMDFKTVTIMPDGTIVGSFDDVGTQREPAIFVEQGVKTYRPDAMIRAATGSRYLGDGVYNMTGAGQSVDANLARPATETFYLKARNDGEVPDRLTITAPGSQQGYVARYYVGKTEVTKSVIGGSYVTGLLAPGAATSLRLVVTASTDAVPGSIGSWFVTVSSRANRLARDGVRAEVTLSAG